MPTHEVLIAKKERAEPAAELPAGRPQSKDRDAGDGALPIALDDPIHHDLRRFKVNDDYFKEIDTPNKAYIFGLLASDGNLTKKDNRVRLRLNKRDASVLVRIREDMGIERPITFTKYGKGSHLADLSFTSREISRDLINAGLRPSTKSLDLEYPSQDILPKRYNNDFIRGFFDGDGSIAVSSNKGFPEFRMNFTGTREILETIRRNLHDEAGLPRPVIYKDKRTTNCHYFSFSGTGNANKLYNYLYGKDFDISTNIAIERKYNRMRYAHETFKRSLERHRIVDKDELSAKIIELIKERPRNTSELTALLGRKHETIARHVRSMKDIEEIYPKDKTGPGGYIWRLKGQRLEGHIYPEEVPLDVIRCALKPSQINTYNKAVEAGYFYLDKKVGNKELARLLGEKIGNVQKKMLIIRRKLMNELRRRERC